MRYCSACGAQNETGAKYCMNCGKLFEYAGGEPANEEIINAAADAAADSSEYIVAEYSKGTDQSECTFAYPIPDANPNKGKGITWGIFGFILGLQGLVYSWVPFVHIWFLIHAILGLIFCNKSLKYMDFRLAKAGKIISIIGIVICSILILFTIFMLAFFGREMLEMLDDLLTNVHVYIDVY